MGTVVGTGVGLAADVGEGREVEVGRGVEVEVEVDARVREGGGVGEAGSDGVAVGAWDSIVSARHATSSAAISRAIQQDSCCPFTLRLLILPQVQSHVMPNTCSLMTLHFGTGSRRETAIEARSCF